MDRRTPPQTEEGWYVLHDFRSIDWDAWRDAPERRRSQAIDEGIEYLAAAERLEDADAGDSATFSVLGHKADLLILHLRPTLADIDALERQFEHTAFAEFTERADSYVSVTEVSGYLSQEYFEEDSEVEETGIKRYIESRLEPEIPDAEFCSFYPMDKRRGRITTGTNSRSTSVPSSSRITARSAKSTPDESPRSSPGASASTTSSGA